MKRKEIVLIGGGGHCKACIDVIEQTHQYDIIGILDLDKFLGTEVLGYKVIGNDNDIDTYNQRGCHFLITVGQIKTADPRKRIFSYLKSINATIATIISPQSYVSNHAIIGRGTIVMHGATVNAATIIGENCILNTNCNIEHDVIVGDNVHISTHSIINGNCSISNDVFIGSNVAISNQVKVEKDVIIGIGSVVVSDIDREGLYVGNPLRKVR